MTNPTARRAPLALRGIVLAFVLACCVIPDALADARVKVPEGEYEIHVGDELGIKFFYNPALNEEVKVRPDGRISLQLIDEVVAAGKTAAALTKELRELYSAEMDRPEISVIVRTFAAQRVYVDGEVAKPGEFPIEGELTVLQAIAQAGGVTDRARLKDVLVIRKRSDGTPAVVRVDVRKNHTSKNVLEDFNLAPSDIVFVSRKTISDVNIWIDQYIRKNIPITVTLGYRVLLED